MDSSTSLNSPPRSRASLPTSMQSSRSPLKPHPHATRPPPTIPLAGDTPRRILIPTTRPLPPPVLHRSPRIKQSAAKLTRPSRSSSIDLASFSELSITNYEHAWLKSMSRLKMDILETGQELSNYQIFSVEKWLVERSRLITTVAVYTGNPKDKILVTVLAPHSTLGEQERNSEFDKAILELRKDGARPREEAGKGVIMITSLANFRSDLNIVQIPGGDFLSARDRLYVNIDLSRMGCSGRSALTLDEPYPSSKEKFQQMYHLSDAPATSDPNMWFQSCVLELVRIVQTGLCLFGLYSLAPDERDGLLCDMTVDGMQKWANEIGATLELEPIERVLEPTAVASLLSVIIALRTKLSALNISGLPRDPFAEPALFLQSIAAFLQRERRSNIGSLHFIDYEVIQMINSAYTKANKAEPYKVHRVLKNKIDDLTTVSTSLANNLNAHLRSPAEPLPFHHQGGHSQYGYDTETTDLEGFVKTVQASKHDFPHTLRDLWTGKPGYHRERGDERMARATSLDEDEDSLTNLLWRGTGKVQKKSQALRDGIAGWTGIDIGRSSKKPHVSDVHESDTSATKGHHHPGVLPALIITSDKSPDATDLDERSPISHKAKNGSGASMFALSPASSVANLAEYERGLRKFNEVARPIDIIGIRARGGSLSEPYLSIHSKNFGSSSQFVDVGGKGEGDVGWKGTIPKGRRPKLEQKDGSFAQRILTDDMGIEQQGKETLSRRKSFSDAMGPDEIPRLNVEYLKIDVELCTQNLILREREEDLRDVHDVLQILLASVQDTSAHLSDVLASQTRSLPLINAQRAQITSKTRQGRDEAGMLHREAEQLNYQVERLQEGVERLDLTLEGYAKRTDDAEAAVKGLYQIQPFVDPEAQEDTEDGGTISPTPSEEPTAEGTGGDAGSPRVGMGWTGTVWNWLLPSLMEPPSQPARSHQRIS